MHHALALADFFVGDSQTIIIDFAANEADASIGIPAEGTHLLSTESTDAAGTSGATNLRDKSTTSCAVSQESNRGVSGSTPMRSPATSNLPELGSRP